MKLQNIIILLLLIIIGILISISIQSNNSNQWIINALKKDNEYILDKYRNSTLDCISGDEGFGEASYYADLYDLNNLSKDEILEQYSCYIGGNRIKYKDIKNEIDKVKEQINQRFLMDFLYSNYGYIYSTDWIKGELQSDENYTFFDLSMIDIEKFPFLGDLQIDKNTYSDENWQIGELEKFNINDFNIQCKEKGYNIDLKSRIQNGVLDCKLIENILGYEIELYKNEIKDFENKLNSDIGKYKK